jgi:hypothetical protein
MTTQYHFASCKDTVGKREYLVADSEQGIEKYCANAKEIIAWYTNPDPIMVCHHFTWVGNGRRPPIFNISKPFKYGDPKKYRWTPS